MAQYIVSDTDMTSVADAIRSKGGTSTPLAFPTGFTTAINAISGGGGGSDLANIDVYVADFVDANELTITAGALDKYTRTVVS